MYANIIVDISHEKLDKTFQYLVPEQILDELQVGSCVQVPFGKRTLTGYVVELTDEPEYDIEKIKPIEKVLVERVPIETTHKEQSEFYMKTKKVKMGHILKTY